MREKRTGHLDGNEREQSLEIPGLVSLKETTFTHLQTIKKDKTYKFFEQPIKTQS